mgnify:CR=1 FL=1
MNKTININLAGFIFHMDEQAFFELKKYLDTISGFYTEREGKAEIIQDIEARIAELFNEKNKDVITIQDVEEVIIIMGKPEDYLQEEELEGDTYSNEYDEKPKHPKRFFRHPQEKIIGGVCGGAGAYFNIDPLWIRLGFVFGVLLWGLSPLVYLLLWLIIPEAKTRSEKLQMQGEPINIDNISKAIKEEISELNDNIKDSGFEDKIKNFIKGILNFIKSVFRFIFKFIGGLFGVFLFIIGLSMFIGLIALLIGAPAFIISSNDDFLFNMADLSLMSDIYAYSTLQIILFSGGVILGLLAPAFLLIYLGLRLLSNIATLPKITIISAIVVSFIGLFMFGASAIIHDHNLNSDYDLSEPILMEALKSDTIYLEVDNSFIAKHNLINKFSMNEDTYYLNRVHLEISESKQSSEPYLELVKSANGPNRISARDNAENISFAIKGDSTTLFIPNNIGLSMDTKYRKQGVLVNLAIPQGKTIYLNNSLDYLHQVIINNCYWCHNTLGNYYTMTSDGLKCLDCIND